jgi:peptide deformylase
MVNEVEIFKLVPETDPILRQPTQKWDFDNPPFDLPEFVETMCETMVKRRGVGLSANQVGVPYSIFVIGHPDTPDDIICVINPKIVDHSENVVLGEEGCLTYEALYGMVKRYDEIRVRFSNPMGDTETTKLTGFTARIFQHEYDHLQGIVYLDRMNRYHKEKAFKQRKHMMKIRKRHKL